MLFAVLGEQVACCGTIVTDLLSESLLRGEFTLGTYEVEQLHLDGVTVEVAVEVEQMGLHTHHAILHHRRTAPDVDHSKMTLAVHRGLCRIYTTLYTLGLLRGE